MAIWSRAGGEAGRRELLENNYFVEFILIRNPDDEYDGSKSAAFGIGGEDRVGKSA